VNAELERFQPVAEDWTPLLALVEELLDHEPAAIVTPLLRVLDRFHSHDGFAAFWAIVQGLEQLPRFPALLVSSLQHTPTRNGLTLLLRVLAREVTTVDGVDLVALATELQARADASAAAVEDPPDR
jgi:hypothetical protein